MDKTLEELKYEWRDKYENMLENFHEHDYYEIKATLATYLFYERMARTHYHDSESILEADLERKGISI